MLHLSRGEHHCASSVVWTWFPSSSDKIANKEAGRCRRPADQALVLRVGMFMSAEISSLGYLKRRATVLVSCRCCGMNIPHYPEIATHPMNSSAVESKLDNSTPGRSPCVRKSRDTCPGQIHCTCSAGVFELRRVQRSRAYDLADRLTVGGNAW